jgi:hypothetical protein
VAPFKEREGLDRADAKAGIADHASRLAIVKGKITKLQDKVADGKPLADDLAALVAEKQEMEENTPRDPVRYVDDVTPESLSEQMSRNKVLGMISGEAGFLTVVTSRYCKSVNIRTFLGGWSGDGTRIIRKNSFIDVDGILSVLCMAQRSSIREMAKVVALEEDGTRAKDTGLMSRFMFSLPRNMVGMRRLEENEVDPVLLEYWNRTVNRLMSLPQEGTVVISKGARDLQRQWALAIEARMGRGRDLEFFSDWGGKAQRGHSSRVAGLLHMLEHERDPLGTELSERTMKRALKVCDYFMAHSREAYDMAFSDQAGDPNKVKEAMDKVLKFARKGGKFNARDSYVKTGIRPAALAKEAVEMLVSHFFLLESVDGNGKPLYELNPKAREK